MSALSGGVAMLLSLALLIVTAGCDEGHSVPQGEATQQLVRDQLQSGTARLESRLESRMQALERGMESRLESIEDRLTLLDSRMEELTGRLDGQQTQLDEVVTQLNGQKSQQDETTVTVNDLAERLSAIATNMEKHVTEMRQLATRLDSQHSQPDQLDVQPTEQKTMDSDATVTIDNGTVNQQYPRDCSDLPVDSPSGVYLLRPSGDSQQPPVEAYCDMDTDGGRWTVFQRRDNIQPRQDFYLGWKEYKEGFGNVAQEFWWGLQKVRQLTSSNDRRYELRIDLEAFDGNRSYATYQGFGVSSEVDGYRLSASNYTGTAGDGLRLNVNMKFSTRDRDQDDSSYRHCAQRRQGAWWHGACGSSSLNGPYRDGGEWAITGIWWWKWRDYNSLKKTEMKIRPAYLTNLDTKEDITVV
ncbi:microfibril-associated glycoprotein 4-like [Amphibalanus amphitrite]|uniref:microfibril-associated glycoprotein 4-like n=1 Tax=Amphibalanus amphitrite TaxID=1232801 RepID=UPI001C90CDA8|nr:microfibril-associated glycoprotein 4-like [Amphibalanus amphitrite]